MANSQQQAANGGSPTPQAAPGTSPAPDNEMSALVSEEVREQVEEAAIEGSPPEPEPSELPASPEPEHREPPVQNLLGEQKRLIDKLHNELELVKNQLNVVQQARVQPQEPAAIAKPARNVKIGDIINREVEAKFQAGELSWERPNEVFAYRENRTEELLAERNLAKTRMDTVRFQSASAAVNKAKTMGYDLNNVADPLAQNVQREIATRAASVGMSPQEYIELVPTVFEDALNKIAWQLNPQQPAGAPRRELAQTITPPVSDIPTARRKVVEKGPEPTDVDKTFSNRYGSDFKRVTEVMKSVRNPETFEVMVPIDLD